MTIEEEEDEEEEGGGGEEGGSEEGGGEEGGDGGEDEGGGGGAEEAVEAGASVNAEEGAEVAVKAATPAQPKPKPKAVEDEEDDTMTEEDESETEEEVAARLQKRKGQAKPAQKQPAQKQAKQEQPAPEPEEEAQAKQPEEGEGEGDEAAPAADAGGENDSQAANARPESGSESRRGSKPAQAIHAAASVLGEAAGGDSADDDESAAAAAEDDEDLGGVVGAAAGDEEDDEDDDDDSETEEEVAARLQQLTQLKEAEFANTPRPATAAGNTPVFPGGAQERLAALRRGADEGVRVNLVVLQAALLVCAKRCDPLGDQDLDRKGNAPGAGIGEEMVPLVTKLETTLMKQCSLFELGQLPEYVFPEHPQFPAGQELQAAWRIQKGKRNRRAKKESDEWAKAAVAVADPASLVEVTSEVLGQVEGMLMQLQRACAQYHVNGKVPKNVWIVKPAGKSRGRGIKTFNELDKLLGYVNVAKHKEAQWVVQKYIENPLILAKRKFDIRQWVMVTDWNPLTIWFMEDSYLRFCVSEYDLTDLDDKFIHLANNSIGKNHKDYGKTYKAEQGCDAVIDGNMMHSTEFAQHLKQVHGSDKLWYEQIKPQLQAIVRYSLMVGQDMVDNRKNSCELYGYDFMVDDQHMPYLIEVNSSPACDYSTGVTERIVKAGLEDGLKVLVEHREWERKHGQKPKKSRPPAPDTGCWTQIYKGPFHDTPISSFGSEFEVKGGKISNTAVRKL
jgi:outer membrane biosynthesis protein TonB